VGFSKPRTAENQTPLLPFLSLKCSVSKIAVATHDFSRSTLYRKMATHTKALSPTRTGAGKGEVLKRMRNS